MSNSAKSRRTESPGDSGGGYGGSGGGGRRRRNVIATAVNVLCGLIINTYRFKTNILRMLLKEDICQIEVLRMLSDSIVT